MAQRHHGSCADGRRALPQRLPTDGGGESQCLTPLGPRGRRALAPTRTTDAGAP